MVDGLIGCIRDFLFSGNILHSENIRIRYAQTKVDRPITRNKSSIPGHDHSAHKRFNMDPKDLHVSQCIVRRQFYHPD